jgi:hypothetical protein
MLVEDDDYENDLPTQIRSHDRRHQKRTAAGFFSKTKLKIKKAI